MTAERRSFFSKALVYHSTQEGKTILLQLH